MTRPKELFTTGFTQGNRELLLPPTLQFQIIGVVGEEGGGGPTDNLNINKRGGPNKRGGSENCSQSKVATCSH